MIKITDIEVIAKIFQVILIITITTVAIRVSWLIVDRIYKRKPDLKNEKTINAIEELIRYLIKYISYILAIMLILGVFGLDIKSIWDFLTSENTGPLKYLGIIIKIIVIYVVTRVTVKILNTLIDEFFKRQKQSRFGLNERKADTLSELLKNTMRYVLYFVALLWMVDQTGFNVKALVAVTGAVGVAVGFGAQTFIKDVISGFLILFEDQFAVGDYIVIDSMSGIVETVGLRITKIRDFSGDLNILPNGTIGRVTNKSRGSMRALVDVDVSYDENIDNVIGVIKGVCEGIKSDFQDIVDGPNVLGVTKLGESGVTIRIFTMTQPMKQWGVENELRKRIKDAFDREGIEIPYPRRVLINHGRGDNSGN